MTADDTVAIIGAGAAGLAAAHRLMEAGLTPLVLEARDRIGGRAHTVHHGDLAIDLGCEWLHSADLNPWVEVARSLGLAVSAKAPPWRQTYGDLTFTSADLTGYRDAADGFEARIEAAAQRGEEGRASDWLEPGNRWNPLLDAYSSYYNGTEWNRVSITDFHRYVDTGENWHLPGGYGHAIATYGANVPVRLNCPVHRIEHGGPRLRLTTPEGTLEVGHAILTVPPTLLKAGTLRLSPEVAQKSEAAEGLPLGVANKVFLSVTTPEALPQNAHGFGRTDRAGTGSYIVQSRGRPVIQGYFGGACAAALEREGAKAFTAFAIEELVGLIGADLRKAVAPLATTAWADDPFSLGAYSHALPFHADDRALWAAPVAGRLFFAGEACSIDHFSTAHGAYLTGRAAAEAVLGATGRTPTR